MRRMRVFSAGLVAVGALIASACTTGGGGGTGGGGIAPVAVIGVDQSSGVAPLTVAFTSAGSTDADGTITSRAWDFGDPASGANNSASTATATHVFASAGTYFVTLLVTDNTALYNSTQSTIVVSAAPVNLPPVAVATPSATSGKAPLAVTFTGDQSSDPDDSIASYLWTFGDAGSGALNTATTANASHTFSSPGSYIATLKVTDQHGATNTAATGTITVNPNQNPSAHASATPLSGKEPLVVAFSSAGTTDSDDATASLTYSWNFGDGTAASTSASPSHTYSSAVGSPFTATLTVTDPFGGSDQKTVIIGVNANQAPTAIANADVTAGPVPLTVHFTGSGSTDDGTIVEYLWTFEPGLTSTNANPTYTFGATGNYPVTLRVKDDNGIYDTTTININVTPIPNVPPIAVASVAPASGKQGTTFQFTGDQSSDPDNTPGPALTYLWDFGDGATSTLANPSHSFSLTGNRTVQLQVKDAANGTNTATVQVQVDLDQPPTASASGTPLTGKAPLLVSLSSAGTSDADDATATLTYLWTFTGGATSNLANPTFSFPTAGSKTAVLRVTDPFGKFDEKTVTITATANQNPVAVANGSPGSGLEDLTVNFDSAGTSDPDDATATLTYAWNFGDPSSGSNTSTAASPSHLYATPGAYTATLTVTDPYGGTNSATTTVTVYLDADGDHYSPNAAAGTGVDCNDSNAAINPGATDALDTSATDSNCDGYDGVASDTVFVSATGSDSTGSGTGTSPYQTVTKALAQLGARHVIQVTNGVSFAGFSISGTTGLTIRGGFASDFKSRSGTTTVTGGVTATSATSLKLEYLTIAGPGGLNTTGVTLTTVTNPTLSFLTVTSGTASGAGSSAYGLRAVSSTGVAINNSSITASAGIAGTAGTTQAAATSGANGNNGVDQSDHGGAAGVAGGSGSGSGGAGGLGGRAGCRVETGNGCVGANDDGSTGGTGTTPSGGGAGGTGGGGGGGGNGAFDYTGDGGNKGNPGATGAAGTAGANAGPGDSAYGATYTPISGAAGTAGKNGGGGGAGGGGGIGCGYGACIGDWWQGGGGGSGGQGGTAGLAGNVGTGGGSSFAVYSFNSTVTIDANTTLTTGNGGTGGNGAAGQVGGTGGAGGKGGIGADGSAGTGGAGGAANLAGADGADGGGYSQTGAGGGGGGGGNGGAGGASGGGAGGSSIAMLAKGTGSITFAGNQATQVTIGTGGTGGSGGSGSVVAGTAAKAKNVA